MRIDFTGTAPKLDLNESISGFSATVQNALVNVSTRRGSDRLYPDRGTTLQQDGQAGRMVNPAWAANAAGFAALDTLGFLRKVDLPRNADRLQKFTLQVKRFRPPNLTLAAEAVSATGQVGILRATI